MSDPIVDKVVKKLYGDDEESEASMPGYNLGEIVVYDEIQKLTMPKVREEWESLIRHIEEDALDRREMRELAFLSLRIANGE